MSFIMSIFSRCTKVDQAMENEVGRACRVHGTLAQKLFENLLMRSIWLKIEFSGEFFRTWE
jgi:hypothetical protein